MPEPITTYEVMKRPLDSTGSYYLHIIDDAPLDCLNGEDAIFTDLQEAYAEADKVAKRGFETGVQVVETTRVLKEFL
jgi:hypothetical protein